MRSRLASLFATLFAAALLAAGGCSSSTEPAQGPLVLAAASLQESMEAAADAWAAEGHPRPVLSFAATPALARQVEAGSDGDLFVSADEKWMDELEAKKLLAPGTRADFLGNRLVLVAPARQPVTLAIAPGFPLAQALGDGRLAMADPDSVPAGRYGKAALVSLGVWDSVAGKIAAGDSVRAALALVGRGEAPLGIVYATDARAEPGVMVAGTFPADSHPPIAYPIARLAASKNADAEGFRQFLLGEEGKAVFRKFGFDAD